MVLLASTVQFPSLSNSLYYQLEPWTLIYLLLFTASPTDRVHANEDPLFGGSVPPETSTGHFLGKQPLLCLVPSSPLLSRVFAPIFVPIAKLRSWTFGFSVRPVEDLAGGLLLPKFQTPPRSSFFFFKTGFFCVALTILEHAL